MIRGKETALARATRTKSTTRGAVGTSSRSKRDDILASAPEHFGRQGYEDTKWADVAADVGVGSTALYHYFESKLHCLYEIQVEALEAEHERFERLTAARGDFGPMLVQLMNALFELSEHEVLRNRVLV